MTVSPQVDLDAIVFDLGSGQLDPAIVTPVEIGPKQSARRRRIIEAALHAGRSGDEALQVRSVALSAHVAPSTVYRYFSSKDDLLVVCLHHWLIEISSQIVELPYTADQVDALLTVVERVTLELCKHPTLAESATSAYLYPDAPAVANTELCRIELSRMFTAPLDGLSEHQSARVGDLIADIWALNIPAIIQKRESVAGLLQRVRITLNNIGTEPCAAMVS